MKKPANNNPLKLIRFINHTDINKSKWDECIENAFNKNFFSYSAILDILSPNWNALIADDYSAVFPLTGRKKYGINYLYQPFFISFFDLYCNDEKTYKRFTKDILINIPTLYKYIDISIAPALKNNNDSFIFNELRYQALEILQPTENIKKKFSDNTIRNIKKAEKAKLQISTAESVETHVKNFKKEFNKKLKVFSEKDYLNMKKLLQYLQKQQRAIIVSAESNKVPCAWASFIFCNNNIVYFKSSANESGKKNGAIHFIINHIIETYGDKYNMLDFYGSNVETVMRFNKGFGANDYIYYKAKKNKLPALLRLIKK